jgi:hypothetical protein
LIVDELRGQNVEGARFEKTSNGQNVSMVWVDFAETDEKMQVE